MPRRQSRTLRTSYRHCPAYLNYLTRCGGFFLFSLQLWRVSILTAHGLHSIQSALLHILRHRRYSFFWLEWYEDTKRASTRKQSDVPTGKSFNFKKFARELHHAMRNRNSYKILQGVSRDYALGNRGGLGGACRAQENWLIGQSSKGQKRPAGKAGRVRRFTPQHNTIANKC